jgi:NAD(P)-dependent dehydrogenase (short-subunit alcohol dehydrogenase family)
VELFSLSGRRALVTGASRGIGRAIALGFAQAGADVAVLARSAEDLEALAGEIRSLGRAATPLVCDVTDAEQVEAAVERFGDVDILVNNAGGPIFNAEFLDTRPEGWLRVLDLNLMSVIHVTRAAGRGMVQRRSGSVINVDSIGAAHPAPPVTCYSAAKAAVVNLTKSLAQEWGPAQVRVNALSPGLIDTEINRRIVSDPERSAAMVRRIPMGRWGGPEDMVGTAIWLASDASAYVTGAHIEVDGGSAALAPQRVPN